MKLASLAVAVSTLALAGLWARAEDFKIGDWAPDHVRLIPGKNSEGSAVLLSPDNPHSSKQSVKCVYSIQEGGYAEYNLNPQMVRPALMQKSGPLKVSFWVRGNPESKLASMNVRVIDATGEIFQYPLKGIIAALQKSDWTLYTTEIDLEKSIVHFSGNKDGVLDYPVKLLTLSVDCGGTDSGSFFIDDLNWEQGSK